MGKASRRKHAAEQQRLYFEIKGDARNAEDRAQARAMLDKLQKKLDDDALREDGFYFVDGKYVDARRARFTPGMKTQSYVDHRRKITAVAMVAMEETEEDKNDLNSWVVTFATDCVCVWNMKTGEQLGAVDLSSRFAIHICGAATSKRLPTPLAMARDHLWVAFAMHQQPTVLIFDLETRQFSSTTAASETSSSSSTTATTTDDLSVGHQQQITCMAFSHHSAPCPQLATCSMDSTCILWKVDDHHTTRLGLTILLMIPGADAGLTSCVFMFDDRELLTVGGDGTIKVWDLTQPNLQQPSSLLLHHQHMQWNETEPYSLSVAHTMDLLLFDDSLPSYHANDDWVDHRHRNCYGKTDSLAMPVETPQAHKVAETTSSDPDTVLDRATAEEPISEVEKLRREYEKIERFDFEMLLNPAASVLRLTDDFDNQSPALHDEQLSSITSIHWPMLTPDADGRLLRCFQRRKANGDFAGHTSTVSDCAVAKESDLVVTVSYDKSIICWSIGHGLVVSITRDAHTAPITSCALTCPTTSRPRDLELLLATAAKDNLIKVWRIGSAETRELQCVYTLTGHYDAITSLRFDASGVFLVSCSDDTLAHCWRVRPAPPDAPPKPLVLHVDKFAITIQWSVPLANGSALTKYVVHTQQLTSFTEDGIDLKIIKDRDVGAKYKSVVVDNLQPGIQYRLCVAAVNAVGQSVWSETTDAVETLAFAPSKVDRAVQYREITANSVRLSWKAPCANGASIRRYTVRCVPENAMFVPVCEIQVPVQELLVAVAAEPTDTKRRAATSKTKTKATPQATKMKAPVKLNTAPPIYEYVMHALWPGEVYQFVVAAENRCGLGAFSPFSDYIKMESTAPDAPTQPMITHVDKRFAEIAWIKPRSNGSEILQYIVEWSQLPISTESASESDPGSGRCSATLLTKTLLGTTYRIDGLQPGRPLCVWVAATNLVHGKLSASPFSPPSELVSTLCDVPDQPTKPQLLAPTAHSLVVAIHAPCDNGAAISEFQIALFCEEIQFGIVSKKLVREFVLRPEQFETRQVVEQAGPPQMCFSIFKLRARTFYSATVVAVNDLGSSPVSDGSIAVSTKPPTVPATLCDPPRITNIEPTRAHISWQMPTHDGGAPLASFVLQYSINSGACDNEIVLFQGRELLLEQLKPNTSYAFRVAATNGVGRAAWSPLCNVFTTPSLVEFTIATYFASRPPLEHAKATVLQRRYRLWKRRTHDRDKFMKQLTKLLATITNPKVAVRKLFRKGPSLHMELQGDRSSGAAAAMSAMANAASTTSNTNTTHLHGPPAIARVSPGNIRSLILEKEKELHDINEYRIHTLEALLREKEGAAQAYKQKFSKLQEDFKYNLKLLEGRDEELALYDTNFASIKSVLRDREAEISELKAQVADVQSDLKQEQKRASEQEAYFQQKLKDARAQMEGARWNFDDELRRVRDEMETNKRKTERQLREQQEDLETQRREMSITFDDVMRQRETEFKQTVEEFQNKTRELELKLKSTQRESEMAKDRCEELKIKMENMQQLLTESEKETKAMGWQTADLRASKDAKIHELEDEILKLQDVKQSLLDEYEGKMAELLQSLHSVEKAFVQQKAQYDEELQRQIRKKDDDAQNMTLRMDAKVQSLMAKLRANEEQCEKLQAEIKQLTWESEDKLLEKDREIDRLKQEVGDVSDQSQSVVSEMKQQLWTNERETQSLQEKLKDATLQLQVHKEKEKVQRQELLESMEKLDGVKRELVTVNLRWENKYQELEQELSTRHDTRVKDLQQARERLVTEKQALEDRLVHSENELHRLRSEMLTLKSDARISASFGSQFQPQHQQQQQQQQRRSREEDAPLSASFPAPSPLWSDDNGTLSPIAGMSPLLTESPQRVVADRQGSGGIMEALQAENAKLKELIHQMRDALSQQAHDLSSTTAASPERGGDANMVARLQSAEKQCVLLEAKLQETESRLASQAAASPNGENGGGPLSEQLTLCQAELIQAKRSIGEKTRRIAELEHQVETLQQQQTHGSSALSADHVMASAEVSDLRRQLSSSHSDIDRLVKERTQLMELSNKLTAELRKLKESTPSTGGNANSVEFSGKKDYENLIADLSRSLEESRLHNKTLKKELRRMVKLQVAHGQQGGGTRVQEHENDDGARSRATSIASSVASTADGGERRRPSTLSMMRALETSGTGTAQPNSRRSSAGSNGSSSSVAPPASLFDEELMSLVRNKIVVPEPSKVSLRAAPSKRAATAVIPPSIPEDAEEEEQEEEEEKDEDTDTFDQDARGQSGGTGGGTGADNRTSLSMLFSRDRHDSMASSAASASAPVSDARMRLQQAKEMLLLAGKKAERSASLASSASASTSSVGIHVKSSDRATASQKSAIKKLKELQTKRAEMVSERKKVRNYSMAT